MSRRRCAEHEFFVRAKNTIKGLMRVQADLASLAAQCEEQLGIINRRLLVRALKLYGAFAELHFVFDNRRLLEEGLGAPMRLVDYIDRCVISSAEVGIQEQMASDFK